MKSRELGWSFLPEVEIWDEEVRLRIWQCLQILWRDRLIMRRNLGLSYIHAFILNQSLLCFIRLIKMSRDVTIFLLRWSWWSREQMEASVYKGSNPWVYGWVLNQSVLRELSSAIFTKLEMKRNDDFLCLHHFVFSLRLRSGNKTLPGTSVWWKVTGLRKTSMKETLQAEIMALHFNCWS